MKSNWVLIIILIVLVGIVGLIVYLGAPGYRQARLVQQTPILLKAWVLSQTLSNEPPSTDSKRIRAGTPVKLYALIKVEEPKTHRPYYITKAKNPYLYGRPLSPSEIQSWDAENWLPVSLFWSQVDAMQSEEGSLKFYTTYLKDWNTTAWEKDLTDDDLKPVGIPYHKEPVGRLFFTLEARVLKPDGTTLYQARSVGEKDLQNDPASSAIHRIVIVPEGHYGDYAKAYYNVPFLKVGVPDEYIRNYVALHPFALPLVAYELKHNLTLPSYSIEQLEMITEPLIQDVQCDIQEGTCTQPDQKRRGKTQRKPLVFGTDVTPGDVLVATDRACILMADRGPDDVANGTLDINDLILCGHPDERPPYPMEQKMSSGFPIQQFDIRRFHSPT